LCRTVESIDCEDYVVDKKMAAGANPQPIIEEVSAHQKQKLAMHLSKFTALINTT